MGRNAAENDGVAPYDFGGNWTPSSHELARRLARKNRNKRNAIVAGVSSLLVLGSLALVIVTSPGWKLLSETFFAWAYGVEVLPKIILGFGTNVVLTIIAGTSVAILGPDNRTDTHLALTSTDTISHLGNNLCRSLPRHTDAPRHFAGRIWNPSSSYSRPDK